MNETIRSALLSGRGSCAASATLASTGGSPARAASTSAGEPSMPFTTWPAAISARATRPSPQPTSTVRRPGSGTSSRKAGRLKRQANTSASPEKRIQSPASSSQAARSVTSLREVDRPALPDHRHLDLTRVLELLLDVARDPVREQRRGVVVDLLGLHDHADLAAGLHRVHLVDAVVALGDLLELTQPLRVVLERLPARARAGAGERVDDLDDRRLDRLDGHLVVMRLHRVSDGLGFLVLARELAPDESVWPLDLVGHRLADVMQQCGAGGGALAGSELGREHAGEVRALDR